MILFFKAWHKPKLRDYRETKQFYKADFAKLFYMREFHKTLHVFLFPKCSLRRRTLLGRHVKMGCIYVLYKQIDHTAGEIFYSSRILQLPCIWQLKLKLYICTMVLWMGWGGFTLLGDFFFNWEIKMALQFNLYLYSVFLHYAEEKVILNCSKSRFYWLNLVFVSE